MKRVGQRLGACILAVTMVFAAPAMAQTPSASHLATAWAAVRAVGADYLFDQALPDIAGRLAAQMKDQRPDLADEVEAIIYDVALELVPRRLDLNNEVSLLWASSFTEDELEAIIEFYSSDVGVKLNQMFADMQQQTLQLLDAWYQRMMSEVRERTIVRLQQQGIEF